MSNYKGKDPWLAKQIASESPILFTDDFKLPSRNQRIVFEAESYQRWVYDILPDAKDWPKLSVYDSGASKAKVCGTFKYALRELPLTTFQRPFMFSSRLQEVRAELDIYSVRGATVAFSDAVCIPILFTGDCDVWMSLAPAEVRTQQKLVRVAKGNVAIAGMGMGWLAQKVIAKPTVTELTVIDKDSHVLSLFGKHVKAVAEKFGKSVNLVCCDAYEYDWTQHTQALWDIWLRANDGSDDWRYWMICERLRSMGISCHGWYTVKPSDFCVRRMRQEAKVAKS